MGEERLTKAQIGALKEVGMIGAGNAATGISQMLGKEIDITVPRANVVALEKVTEILGGPEVLVTVVYFQVTGAVSGIILIILPVRDSLRLADLLIGRTTGDSRTLDEFGQSALKELGNISTASYLIALSKMVRMKLFYSVPNLATDMLGAILDNLLIKLSLKAKQAVVVETEFTVKNRVVKGHLIFMPEPDGLKAILGALGV